MALARDRAYRRLSALVVLLLLLALVVDVERLVFWTDTSTAWLAAKSSSSSVSSSLLPSGSLSSKEESKGRVEGGRVDQEELFSTSLSPLATAALGFVVRVSAGTSTANLLPFHRKETRSSLLTTARFA
jgi:hypothetical protein